MLCRQRLEIETIALHQIACLRVTRSQYAMMSGGSKLQLQARSRLLTNRKVRYTAVAMMSGESSKLQLQAQSRLLATLKMKCAAVLLAVASPSRPRKAHSAPSTSGNTLPGLQPATQCHPGPAVTCHFGQKP
eukprot:TRINITY_DN90400_c0_g1_i1.p1 TRINITY_DN90400_c0_g1~~TRINITY_DN90400_c0_g1_i1.p1  ORF type:complete len:132 (-),score=11.58 TRINITY_DN90400_c0_g1_i1:31-426(-)